MTAIWKHRTSGRIVEADDLGEVVRFWPQGGGFGKTMPAPDFRAQFEPSELPTAWRAAFFAIDDGPRYPGFTQGRKWNGWSIPYFPRDVAARILAEAGFAVHAWTEDELTYIHPDYTDEDDYYNETPVIINGVKCWNIGDGWIWDEHTTASQQIDELADEFSRQLADRLTADELAEVRQRNATEQNPSICHSHDFCDSNEIMHAACVAVVPDYDGFGTEHIELINAAWNAAKARQFRPLFA